MSLSVAYIVANFIFFKSIRPMPPARKLRVASGSRSAYAHSQFQCPIPSCNQQCQTKSGLTKHMRSRHEHFSRHEHISRLESAIIYEVLHDASSPNADHDSAGETHSNSNRFNGSDAENPNILHPDGRHIVGEVHIGAAIYDDSIEPDVLHSDNSFIWEYEDMPDAVEDTFYSKFS